MVPSHWHNAEIFFFNFQHQLSLSYDVIHDEFVLFTFVSAKDEAIYNSLILLSQTYVWDFVVSAKDKVTRHVQGLFAENNA